MTFHWTSSREAERLTRDAARLIGPLTPLTPPASLAERTTTLALALLPRRPVPAPTRLWRLPVLAGSLASLALFYFLTRDPIPTPVAPPKPVTASVATALPSASPASARALPDSDRAVDTRLNDLHAQTAQLERQLTLDQASGMDLSIEAVQASYRHLLADILEQDGRPAARGRRI